MAVFWIIWTFVCLGATAFEVDLAANHGTNHGTSPVWVVMTAGCALLSAFMVYLTWDD